MTVLMLVPASSVLLLLLSTRFVSAADNFILFDDTQGYGRTFDGIGGLSAGVNGVLK